MIVCYAGEYFLINLYSKIPLNVMKERDSSSKLDQELTIGIVNGQSTYMMKLDYLV